MNYKKEIITINKIGYEKYNEIIKILKRVSETFFVLSPFSRNNDATSPSLRLVDEYLNNRSYFSYIYLDYWC